METKVIPAGRSTMHRIPRVPFTLDWGLAGQNGREGRGWLKTVFLWTLYKWMTTEL